VFYAGPAGSGHFVKLVHNAIEFGIVTAAAQTALMHYRDRDSPAAKAVALLRNAYGGTRCTRPPSGGDEDVRAVMVSPGRASSLRLAQVPDPAAGPVLVRVHLVGLDGSDEEIVAGRCGQPPAGEEGLIIGHESLGRVVAVGGEAGLAPGDWVVAMVRRPDPVPCPNCAAGQWHMCLNGLFRRGDQGPP